MILLPSETKSKTGFSDNFLLSDLSNPHHPSYLGFGAMTETRKGSHFLGLAVF